LANADREREHERDSDPKHDGTTPRSCHVTPFLDPRRVGPGVRLSRRARL
jgi:hypothetical protein